MPKKGHTRIIAKDWWLGGIVVIAAFLRLYNLRELSEFLGDQGRTMLVLYDLVHKGIFPVVGPPLIAGQHLGPFFYYLIAPAYILWQSPVAVAVWGAMLGLCAVVVLYVLIRQLFGVWPARLVSLLWAVSPGIVTADRVIWEPNLVPLFVLLYFLSLVNAHRSRRIAWWFAVGVTLGILIQLHYPNAIFIGLTGLYFVVRLFDRPLRITVLFWEVCAVLLGFLVLLAPFLVYERTVGFTDLRQIFSIFAGSAATPVGRRVIVGNAVDFIFRVFSRALPFMSKPAGAILAILWGAFVLRFRTRKNMFITLLALGGISGMSVYRNVVFDHYLYFLTPVPFLMIATVFSAIPKNVWRRIAIVSVVVLAGIQLARTDVFAKGPQDMARTARAVRQMIDLAGGKPYSFTVIQSRSFSDLHYRYYLAAFHSTPEQITRMDYPLLFIVCDEATCPSAENVATNYALQVMCYDPMCAQFYTTVNMHRNWVYVRTEPVSLHGVTEARIYEFQRK